MEIIKQQTSCFYLTGRDLNGGQQAYSKKSKQQQKKSAFSEGKSPSARATGILSLLGKQKQAASKGDWHCNNVKNC